MVQKHIVQPQLVQYIHVHNIYFLHCFDLLAPHTNTSFLLYKWDIYRPLSLWAIISSHKL